MPILIDHSSRIICFGMATERGRFQIQQALAYGTQVVALVEPRPKETHVFSLPIFASARQAVRLTNGTVALIMSEPQKATDAIMEADEAGIQLIVCLTKEIPAHDMVEALRIMKQRGKSRLIGPGSCGIINPEQARCGLMPGFLWTKGPVGMVSSSDTLAYVAAGALSSSGKGQSTFVGIGEALATSVVDVLELFEQDPYTEMTLLLGLPTGQEMGVCEWLRAQKRKPLAVLLAGHTPLSYFKERGVEAKEAGEPLKKAGATLVSKLTDLPRVCQEILQRNVL